MASYEYIESTGTVLPDTEDLLTTVENEFKDALGAQLNTDPATPQGRLIATEVNARDVYLRNMAGLANQINPRLAQGVFLDAIWALTGGQRIAATKTVVQAVALGGVAGTFIPAGSQARTPAGDVFSTLADATLDGAGVATVDFAADETGPIAAEAGQLNTAVSGILGWETVNNPTDGIIGRTEESDIASRLRRLQTLALQGVALPEAIISGLMDTEGVRSLVFRENVGDVAAVIDGVLLEPHSMYAVVDGGSDLDVATAILAKKSLGCDYNGAVVVNVTEPASGQVYAVRFDRPVAVPLKARATIRANQAVADPATTVRDSMVAYANGEIEGERGFVVGASASPFELAGAINMTAPGIYVQKMEIAKVADAYGTIEVPITIQEIATLNENNIEVVIL